MFRKYYQTGSPPPKISAEGSFSWIKIKINMLVLLKIAILFGKSPVASPPPKKKKKNVPKCLVSEKLTFMGGVFSRL